MFPKGHPERLAPRISALMTRTVGTYLDSWQVRVSDDEVYGWSELGNNGPLRSQGVTSRRNER